MNCKKCGKYLEWKDVAEWGMLENGEHYICKACSEKEMDNLLKILEEVD